jgi:hypothetical protein
MPASLASSQLESELSRFKNPPRVSQLETCSSFENSGAGFAPNLAIAADAPVMSEKSPLSDDYGSVLGIEQGMVFIVFLKDGRLSMVER